MSTDWAADINDMHSHYGFHDAVDGLDTDSLRKLLEFRIKFLDEEMNELKEAECPHDTVDALIDLCVVAIGTLDLFGVDANLAWNRVHKANMNKQRGVKESRPNPLALPDLIKPEGWEAPAHDDNIGLLEDLEGDEFPEHGSNE